MLSIISYRAFFGSLVVILGGFLILSAVAGPVDGGGNGIPAEGISGTSGTGEEKVTNNSIIAMTGQTFGDRAGDALMAFKTERARNAKSLSPDELIYYNNSYDEYHDVDPVPGTRMTVLYVASTHLNPAECEAASSCTFNVIERLNMTTGEVTRFHSNVQPREEGNDVHDVDRISDSELLVADTVNDRVFILNTTTNLITWEWDAQSAYPVSGGGPYPDDWTHLNDVEYLPDRGENGWIMVSLRNQDQVVFVDREKGLVENWTIGAENDYKVVYEQHNPDYIPPEHGGPAVIIADSQNDRIVEYQRVESEASSTSEEAGSGEWERTWEYRHLNWPRDADRLPNGNTLLVDSNGGRLLEVDPSGDIVWWTLVPYEQDAMYEAEMLETGDESTNGPSAASMGAAGGRSDSSGQPGGSADTGSESSGLVGPTIRDVNRAARAILPPKIRNAILFVVPMRMSPGEVLAGVILLVVVAAWGVLELRRQSDIDVDVDFQSPVRIRRK